MSTGGVIMMVLVLTLVWGGFAAAVVVAMVHERRKMRSAEELDAGREPGAERPGAHSGGGH